MQYIKKRKTSKTFFVYTEEQQKNESTIQILLLLFFYRKQCLLNYDLQSIKFTMHPEQQQQQCYFNEINNFPYHVDNDLEVFPSTFFTSEDLFNTGMIFCFLAFFREYRP